MMTEPFFSPLIGFPLSAKEKKKKKIDWIDSRHLLAIVCVCVCIVSLNEEEAEEISTNLLLLGLDETLATSCLSHV